MNFERTKIQIQATEVIKDSSKEKLFVGGSRSGKTFIIVRAQLLIARKYPGSRHLLARFRLNAIKSSIWNDTLVKVLSLCFPGMPVKWNHTDMYITLDNGSQLWFAGLDQKDRTEKILGMEFLTIFLNEASQLSYDAYGTIKTRLAQKVCLIDDEGNVVKKARNLLFIDENPPSKKHWTYKLFVENVDPEENKSVDPSRYSSLRMNPIDNLDNISSEYMDILNSMSLRKQKRFKDGEFSDDSDSALWTDDLINATRVRRDKDGNLPVILKRIVVAIDPAVSSKDTSDETGIVVAGVGFNDHLYVLEDDSDIYKPNEWAARAIVLYKKYKADCIIGEVNNGGDMIEAVLRNIDQRVSYKGVHATRDKLTRAEPIAAIYEQGKAHHVDQLLELELEMTTWESKKGEKSPNRIDALVWAATELIISNSVKKAPKYSF